MDHAVSATATIDLNGRAAPPSRPAWTMPKPTLGTVLWRPQDGTVAQQYALVTATYGSMIDCRVVTNDGWLPRAGVKHVSDPSLKKLPGSAPHGVWDFCPGELELRVVVDGAMAIIQAQARVIATLNSPEGDADDFDLDGGPGLAE